ncbi:MAG: glycosyltransferase family 2 protein [Planctomycetaceae bacterium]|nr:glycosyltransferase family 2 protein [Planctomycetaceae bacterium]
MSVVLFWIIAGIVLVHYTALFLYLHRIRQDVWTKPAGDFTPKTMVLLALRGADPSLARTLEAVLTQDYPNYRVRFLIDSAEDPALPAVKAAVAKTGADHAEIKIITEHYQTCALKCNALVHGVADLDRSYEAVAVLDADTNPPKDWLKRLVEPLSDARFPVASGVRWYIPATPNTGSLVRYLWNAAAVFQQNLYQIAWGGSTAFRREMFTQGGLGDRWKYTITDDTPVRHVAGALGGQTAFVSTLFLPNREVCTLAAFHRWVMRQMLCVRLYHPAWKAVIGQAVLITLPLIAVFVTLIIGMVNASLPVIGWCLGAMVLYWAGVSGTVPFMEHAVRRKMQQRGETVPKWTFDRTWRTFAAVPLTQAVYTSALLCLFFVRKIEWRGVQYAVAGKDVRLLEYKPYTGTSAGEDNPSSL